MSRFEEVVNEAIDEVILGEAFKAETLAAHIAERVRDRQQRQPRRGHDRRPLPRAQAGAQLRPADAGDLHAVRLRRRVRARHAPARRRPGAGHDRLPLRAGDGRRALAGAPARSRLHRRRDRARARGGARGHAQPARDRSRCTSAARRAAPRASRPQALLSIVESSMSSEIYELMKRSDEVEVVEKAHRRPRFVEDCVREMVRMATERFAELGDGRLRLRPPGEPRDDPQAQRGRRALRAPRRAPTRDRLRRAPPASPQHARVARRPRAVRPVAGFSRNLRASSIGPDSFRGFSSRGSLPIKDPPDVPWRRS